jgi:hypothetical protein
MRDVFAKEPAFYLKVSPYELHKMLHLQSCPSPPESYYTKPYLGFIRDLSQKMVDNGDMEKAIATFEAML